MGAVPTTDNAWADLVDNIINAAITGGETGVEAYIAASPVAILEGPVLSLITNEVIEVIGDAIYRNTAKLATALVIDIQTYGEKSKATQAITNLLAAQASGDPNAIAQASAAYDSAMASLIHSDGSANNINT